MRYKGTPPGKDYMPVAPVRRVVKAELERRQGLEQRRDQMETLAEAPVGAVTSIVIDIFGHDPKEIARGSRYIYSVLNENTWIPFDRADQILTRLGFAELWHSDPELRKHYFSDVVAQADEREQRLGRIPRSKPVAA